MWGDSGRRRGRRLPGHPPHRERRRLHRRRSGRGSDVHLVRLLRHDGGRPDLLGVGVHQLRRRDLRRHPRVHHRGFDGRAVLLLPDRVSVGARLSARLHRLLRRAHRQHLRAAQHHLRGDPDQPAILHPRGRRRPRRQHAVHRRRAPRRRPAVTTRAWLVAVVLLAACDGGGGDDVLGVYQTTLHTRNDTGCMPGAAVADPPYFSFDYFGELNGSHLYEVKGCTSSDATTCADAIAFVADAPVGVFAFHQAAMQTGPTCTLDFTTYSGDLDG